MDKIGLSYNTEKKKIIISEYGRNIQEMIQYLTEIPDRAKRTETAEFIVSVMEQMNPQVTESSDYKHKLWDHMHIISDFKLDVDSPYEVPTVEGQISRPRHVDYQNNNIRFGHYGQYVVKMIKAASEIEDEETRNAVALSIANQMEREYVEWNRNVINDLVVIEDLYSISDGKISLPDDTRLITIGEIQGKGPTPPKPKIAQPKKKKKKVPNIKANMNNPNHPSYKKRNLQQEK